MTRIMTALRRNFSWLAACSLGSIAFAIMLMPSRPLQAQQTAGFIFSASAQLNVTGSSSSVAFPGSGSKVLVQNTGSQTAYLAIGNSNVTANTGSFPLTAGACIYFQIQNTATNQTMIGNTTIAGISGGVSTTVLVIQGEGNPPLYCGGTGGGGGGGGSGGSVTQGSTPWIVSGNAFQATFPWQVDAEPGSNLANLVAAPSPCNAEATPSTNSFSAGTQAIQCSLNGLQYHILVPASNFGWNSDFIPGLSTTVTPIKGTAGQVAKLYCYNPNASVAYVQIFNVASGSVSLGTTKPQQSYGIPSTNAAGYSITIGDFYNTAISVAATTTSQGSSAPAVGLDCNVSFY